MLVVALNAGETPASLWAPAQGGALSVWWNAALSDWNLETVPVLPTSEWSVTTSATLVRALPPLEGAARSCRLAAKRDGSGVLAGRTVNCPWGG